LTWTNNGKGGGSTYGVGTTYTLQAIRAGNLAKYTGFISGWEELYRVHSAWNKLAQVGASGYINGHPARGGQLSLTVYLANSSLAHLQGLVRPVLSSIAPKLGKREPKLNGKFTEYESYEAMREARGPEELAAVRRMALASQERPATGTGSSKIIASWLWSAKDVQSTRLRTALRGAFETSTQMMTDATMGAGTQNPPYIRGGSNAVNPALRTAIMRAAAEIHWDGTDQASLNIHFDSARKASASLRSLAPDGGTYANEADPTTQDWQRAFWGTNYAKLLQIKQKVDPGGLFYCRMCVGSEYMNDIRGTLCHK
jgi:FAD/FMN-containing dehydrogenase